MRKFWDERGYVVTDDTLRLDYDTMKKSGEIDDGITFGQYVRNCQASAGGTLTELKEAR